MQLVGSRIPSRALELARRVDGDESFDKLAGTLQSESDGKALLRPHPGTGSVSRMSW